MDDSFSDWFLVVLLALTCAKKCSASDLGLVHLLVFLAEVLLQDPVVELQDLTLCINAAMMSEELMVCSVSTVRSSERLNSLMS